MMPNVEPEKAEKQPKILTVSPEDLVVLCACRKVTMIVKGGKADFRNVETYVVAIRDACALACGCKVVLMNNSRKPHD